MQQVHVDKSQLTDAQVVSFDAPALADGAIRLAIESFSVTANNVTYAVMGDSFRYWHFFPAPDGKGIVPMWGHARVIESRHDDILEGERVYGYLPMATHLDVQPAKVSAGSFIDAAEHRQPMSPIYNQYTRLAADPEHDPQREDERMIFGPLFKTGFLIEHFMRGENWFGAEAVILSSASSKTALGLASVTNHLSPNVRRIGLTSNGNVDFVKKSGLYQDVLSYADIANLPQRPSVLVDFAGNANLLASVHHHLGDTLTYSCLVGATHIEERGGALGGDADLPGPEPTLFFAPDHAVSLFKEHGPQKAGEMVAASWHAFLQDAASSVGIVRRDGLEAARDVFVAMVKGETDPAKGIVIAP